MTTTKLKTIKLMVALSTLLLCQNVSAETGIASHYSVRSNGGTKTASGIPLNDNHMVAAHKTLPLGSIVRVVDLKTNKSVLVRVNDRGPFCRGRIIDLSQRAAEKLGFKKKGLTKVRLEVVSTPKKK